VLDTQGQTGVLHSGCATLPDFFVRSDCHQLGSDYQFENAHRLTIIGKGWYIGERVQFREIAQSGAKLIQNGPVCCPEHLLNNILTGTRVAIMWQWICLASFF
jgi:hypothetical protein